MKQGLHLQLGQQLKMTPQLQQAIRLLQLSALELQQEIQTTIEANPLLELEEETDELVSTVEASNEDQDPQELDLEHSDLFKDDLQVDTSWDDIYPTNSSAAGSAAGSEEDDGWETRNSTPESLYQHLLSQLNLAPLSDADKAIAIALIDALDERGYLTDSLADIRAAVQPLNLKPDDPLFPEDDEIIAVLHLLQHFDPAGIGARNLAECLTIQLNMLSADTPWRSQALQLASEHLELVEARDFDNLRRRTKLNDQQLTEVVALLRSLNPAPGELISDRPAEYVIPDVFVSRRGSRWLVELNTESMPRVRINDHYASMINQTRREEDNSYLKSHLQEARWFLKSLQSRNETLLKVATRIVEIQQGFFEYGAEAMKPLVLAEIAEAVEMHESTISRVTNQKYIHTPKGLFELKYFFSSHVATDGGGECSSTAIRAIIKKLVAAEDARKPLSDNKLAALLNEQGIQVARRTVAKYREALRIPASSERKRLA